jgi:pimeloyl-ACP methyl ester carboxylesterase/DNA-binding winged helix-turn-helix (wHTH) protein
MDVPVVRTVDLEGFKLDTERHELRDPAGRRVALRPQAMQVLLCLARRPGALVTKDELTRVVWSDVVVTDDSLVQCIKLIRRALGDQERRILQTEPKRGYRLVPVVPSQTDARASTPFHQDIRFATSSDGVRIAYATSGDRGPLLVRAAHWMTHLEWDWHNAVYGPWIQGLSRRYRLLRYDGRGTGLSDRGIPMGSLADEVADLAAVVDAAGWERFALFGRSQGGAIAIRYAALHPDRVTHLVLEGSFAQGWMKRDNVPPDSEKARAFGALIELGWGRNDAAFYQLIASEMFPGASAEQREAFITMQRAACTPHDAAQLARMNGEYDALADLPRVRCPTLVLHSPQELCVPFEQGRLIASAIHGARLEPIDSVNHTPLPGEPAFDEVNRLIDEFLLPRAAVHHLGRQAAPALRAVPAARKPGTATAASRRQR